MVVRSILGDMSRHRRFASESATPSSKSRPLSIFSPPSSPVTRDYDKTPVTFEDLAKEFDTKKEKVYHEGYLLKLEEISASGSPIANNQWEEVYASLAGTILSIWPAEDAGQAGISDAMSNVNPTFINITDARIAYAAKSQELAISTTGRNRYLFKAHHRENERSLELWMLAMRLAMFERARMQEIYTSNLFLKFQTKDTTDSPSKDEKWSGLVDVRVTGGAATQSQWTKMWCSVVSGSKRGFLLRRSGKESQGGEADVRFYNNKKDKIPMIVMHGVFSAYCTYPEHISLVESAGVIKVEGNVRLQQGSSSSSIDGFALIIPSTPESPKRLSLSAHTTHAHPMVGNILKLLMAVWTSFELYNRPRSLLLNVDHVDALGAREGSVDLELMQVLGRLPVGLNTEAAWRHALREQCVLQNHYTQVRGKPLTPQSPSSNSNNASGIFKRVGSDRRVLSEGSIVPGARPLVLSIEEEEIQTATSGFGDRTQSITNHEPTRHAPQSSSKFSDPLSASRVTTTTAALRIVTNGNAELPIPKSVQSGQRNQKDTSSYANTEYRMPAPQSIEPSVLSTGFSQRPISQAIHTLPETKVSQVENPARMSYAGSFGDMRTSASTNSIISDTSARPSEMYSPPSPRLRRTDTFMTEASSVTDAQSLILSPHRRPIEESDDEDEEASTPQRSDFPFREADNAATTTTTTTEIRPLQARSSVSLLSRQSSTSVYSAGLDLSALDLVHSHANDSTYAQEIPSTSDLTDTGREGSIYSVSSVNMAPTELEVEPEVVEDEYQKEFKELAARLRRRAGAVEALDISRNHGTVGALFSNPNIVQGRNIAASD